MNDSSPPSVIREGQVRSAFTSILETLCEACVGSVAAQLVDEEGESVDHTSMVPDDDTERMIAYDIKLSGAYWQIQMRLASEQPHLGGVRQLIIHTETFDYVVIGLYGGYALLVICRPGGFERVSWRALRQVEVELCLEAGWPVSEPNRPFWRRARVLLDPEGQPTALSFTSYSHEGRRFQAPWERELQILDASSRPGFERTFRVALTSGKELDLVREPTGYWYAAYRA